MRGEKSVKFSYDGDFTSEGGISPSHSGVDLKESDPRLWINIDKGNDRKENFLNIF